MQLYRLWYYLISSLQFDVFFVECNTPIETVQNTSTELKDAMSNFKRACSVAGVTSSAKASLEECIDGLKQLIRTDDDEDALEVIIALFEVIKFLWQKSAQNWFPKSLANLLSVKLDNQYSLYASSGTMTKIAPFLFKPF